MTVVASGPGRESLATILYPTTQYHTLFLSKQLPPLLQCVQCLLLCCLDLVEGSWKRRIQTDLTDGAVNAQNRCENVRSKLNSKTCTKITHKTLSFCTIISLKIYYKLSKHKITPFNIIKLLHTQSYYY